MATRFVSNFGLYTASFILALFSFQLFAYTPPATPDLPLNFEFLGPNAESESLAFYNTQCDSNNFSWRGTDWFCAVGDPLNPVCYAKMAYHATDVNNCQDSGTDPDNPDPEEPDPNDPTLVVKPFPDIPLPESIAHIFAALDSIYSASTNNIRQSKATTDAVYYVGNQNASNSRMIADKIDFQGQATSGVMREMVNAINSNTEWTSQSQMILAESNNLLKSIEAKTGSDGSGGGTDWPVDEFLTQIYRIGGAVENVSGNTSDLKGFHGTIQGMNGMLSYIMPEQTNILKDINASIKSLGGGSSDDSAILEQFEEANNQLSDIILRMRDIENAIGEGGGGNGSDPDSISQNGCASFQCSSNSPQCFIARKEWEKSCSSIKNESDSQGLIDSLVSNVKSYNESPDSDIQNIDAGIINTDALLNKYTNANGFNAGGSQSCPAPIQLDLGFTSLSIDLQPICDLAFIVSWFVIATAMLSSGLAIAKYS